MPEFVTLNIGGDDPIPPCPITGHAWKRVISNPDATWLSQFNDERNDKASGKYIFLAADSKVKGENDKKKYEKARKLKQNIATIRRDYRKKLESGDVEDQ
jgi:DNA topoisomerase-1